MPLKYLFIDNDEVKGLIEGLEEFSNGQLEIEWIQSHSIDNVMNEIESKQFSGIILDFYLENVDNNKAYKSNPLAQWIRDNAIETSKHDQYSIPIVLFSSLQKLEHGYNIEPTAKDLHDQVYIKDNVGKDPTGVAKELITLANTYKSINVLKKEQHDQNNFIKRLLNITADKLAYLDPRIFSTINLQKAPTHQIVRHLLHEIILTPSYLINENLLAVRLGIDIKNSPGWSTLKDGLDTIAKYTGFLSDGWERWNIFDILNWWDEKSNGNLQSLTSVERVRILIDKFGFTDLKPYDIQKIGKWEQKKTNCWYLCKSLNIPIHPSEGVLSNESKNYSWQENEYYSIGAFIENEELIEQIPFVEVARIDRELKKIHKN